MAEIATFSGVYYNPDKTNKISEVICPATDFLDDDLVKKLRENNNNFSYVTYSNNDNNGKYKNAVHKLYGWLLRDILIIDKSPSFYINEQSVLLDGVEYKRYGIIGMLKIENYDGNIKKQEKTIEKYSEDKYTLLKETQFNLEPAVCLYKDNNNEINSLLTSKKYELKNSLIMYNDIDGNLNKIYKSEHSSLNKEIIKYFNDKVLYVIDGYRYESALKYKEEMQAAKGEKYTGKEPCNYILVTLFNAYDKAMRIYPVNRLVKNLAKNPVELIKNLGQKYKLAAVTFNDAQTEKLARKKVRMVLNDSIVRGTVSYGIYMKGLTNRYFILNLDQTVKDDMADTEILDSAIFNNYLGINPAQYESEVGYGYSDNQAFNAVKNGSYAAAFFTNSIDVFKLLELADKGKWMPYKSINIYPKMMSGSMLYSFRYSKIGL